MPRRKNLRRKGPTAGVGLLRKGQPASPHQLGVCGSAVSSHSGVRGGASGAKRFSRVLSVQSGLSRQFSVADCFL